MTWQTLSLLHAPGFERQEKLRRQALRARQEPWRYAVMGAVLGLVSMVLLQAPAHWLALVLAWATHDQVQLHQVRGTVWQGSAQLVFSGGAGSRDSLALPGRIGWQLNPLRAHAQGALLADCCLRTPLQLTLSGNRERLSLAVSDATSVWPAALLGGLGAPWNTLQPEGDLVFAPQDLAFEWSWHERAWFMQGQLTITAREMASRLTPLKPMGTYRLEVTPSHARESMAQVKLSTVSGKLILAGQGQWRNDHLQFRGQASAAPDDEATLNNLLSIIGRRDGARSLLSWG